MGAGEADEKGALPDGGASEHDHGRGHAHERGHDHGRAHDHAHEHGHAHERPPESARDPREIELEAFVGRVAGELSERDPRYIAAQAGAEFDAREGIYTVRVYGKLFAVRHSNLEAYEAANDHHVGALWLRVLLAHYLRTADGTPLAGEWVSLRELPGGLMYERAFQGYSGAELARTFGPEFTMLRDLGPRYGGQPLDMGDFSLRFDVLPRVPIAVVTYAGDDEFPANARLLFDASATHYLPTDALATVGGRLTRLLLQAAGVGPESAKPITPGWLGR